MATTVQPAVLAGVAPIPTPRLVAALIGRPSRMQTIFIECPEWCVERHDEEPEVAVEDVSHGGEFLGIQVSSMLDPNTAHSELYARVNSDPANEDPRMRAAHVLYGNAAGADAYLTPDMTDELAGELIAFAAQLRAASHTARVANLSTEAA